MFHYNKEYWLCIYDYTYIIEGQNELLVYRTDNNDFVITNNLNDISLLLQLNDLKNMGAISLADNSLNTGVITKLIDRQFLYLLSKKTVPNKPAIIPHVCKLNIDYDKFILSNDAILYQHLVSFISRYLFKLSVYINIEKIVETDAVNYSERFYQMPKGFMSFDLFKKIMSQFGNYPLQIIDIVGDKITNNPYIIDIISLIHSYEKRVRITININELKELNELLKNIYIDDYIININPDFYEKDLLETIKEMSNLKKYKLNFRITCADDYYKVNNFILNNNVKADIIPYFNLKNSSFLKNLLLIELKDIFSRNISWKEIFRNQKINSNLFGKLYIMPNGQTYSDLSFEPLGSLSTDSLSEIIYTELVTKNYWRKTRDCTSCKTCIYRFLCPPPSEYELAMNFYKMCNLQKK